MTVASHPVEEAELHAYVDGQLNAERAREVAAYLEQNPGEAARVAQYAAQRRELRAFLQPRFDEPLPPRLRVGQIRRAQRDRRSRQFFNMAAVAAVALICLTTGWIAYPRIFGARADRLVVEAMAVRDGDVRAERQLNAESVGTAEARDTLAATALALPVKVPDLTKAGYALAGIAIYPGEANIHALQLSYRDGGDRLFTVFLRRSAGPDRFDLRHQGKMGICIWQNEELSAVMLGEMPPREMLKVATMTYSDLNF